jgi:hypothetical protein
MFCGIQYNSNIKLTGFLYNKSMKKLKNNSLIVPEVLHAGVTTVVHFKNVVRFKGETGAAAEAL